jgi:hypothetical protein
MKPEHIAYAAMEAGKFDDSYWKVADHLEFPNGVTENGD